MRATFPVSIRPSWSIRCYRALGAPQGEESEGLSLGDLFTAAEAAGASRFPSPPRSLEVPARNTRARPVLIRNARLIES